MDRHHRQAIQQLQLELAEAKEQSGIQNDDSRFGHTGSKDSSSYLQNNGNQFANDGGNTTIGSSVGTANGDDMSLLSASGTSTKVRHENCFLLFCHPDSDSHISLCFIREKYPLCCLTIRYFLKTIDDPNSVYALV